MDRGSFKDWLEAYGHAWENRNPDAMVRLFTEGAPYCETPFDEPARGREGIFEYWSGATGSQQDVRFSSDVLAVTKNTGIAHWSVSFTRLSSDTTVELDGIFLVKVNGDGLCTEFREWWHSKK